MFRLLLTNSCLYYMERAYRNVTFLFVFIAICVFLGFYKSYFSQIARFETFPLIVHVHAVVFAAWALLLIVQPLLIRYKQLPLHRLLGKFSYFLVPVLVFTIWEMIRLSYARDKATVPFPKIAGHLILPLVDTIVFVVLYILSMIYRKKAAWHMRYIIAAALVLISPSMARFLGGMIGPVGPLIALAIIHLIMISLILYDRLKLKKVYPPYLIAWGMLIASHLVELFYSQTTQWQSIFRHITTLF